MVVILPPFALLMWALFKRGFGWRQAFLLASASWGLLLVVITELLSLCNGLTDDLLALAWLGVAAGIYTTLFVFLKPTVACKQASRFSFAPSFALLFPIIAILAILALVDLVAPPNNFDSMTYHMARVVHWMQNHNVYHYPTHIERQLHQNPGAEFIILHLQILSGGDRYANLVQWFAMVGSVIGVSLIAAQLRASVHVQIFAAALCCSIPMGILQACNTQNDYVIGFWLVCLVSFILTANEETGGRRWLYVLAVGAALGLAVLTKGTAYCYAPPLALWFCVNQVRRFRWSAAGPFIATMAIALALNCGHYYRNIELYGSPIGSGLGGIGNRYKYTNDVHGPKVVISNLIRNTLTDLAIPPMSVSNTIKNAGLWTLGVLGIDPQDPRTTVTGNYLLVPGSAWNDENFAANPIHVVLILLTLPTLILGSWPEKRPIRVYAASLVAGYLILCWLLRYQYWCNRLHLTLIVLWTPLIALAMDRACRKWVLHAISWLLLASVIPVIITNIQHPLIGPMNIFTMPRQSQYDMKGPEVEAFNAGFAKKLQQYEYTRVGLIVGWNTHEYPLWMLLWKNNPDIRIEHISVKNPSARKAVSPGVAPFDPQALFGLDQELGIAKYQFRQPSTQPTQ